MILYDAYGRQVYDGGFTHEDIQAALEAARIAHDHELVWDIATRYGWRVCRVCGHGTPRGRELQRSSQGLILYTAKGTQSGYVYQATSEPPADPNYLCPTCEQQLFQGAIPITEMRMYMNGILKRNVS